jgi:YgiT-type zinc finger domain-containing protein
MKRCNICGDNRYEERFVEYIYKHDDHYLIVRDVPAEICQVCGTRYYDAPVLEEIERRFFEIHSQTREPREQIQVPVEAY